MFPVSFTTVWKTMLLRPSPKVILPSSKVQGVRHAGGTSGIAARLYFKMAPLVPTFHKVLSKNTGLVVGRAPGRGDRCLQKEFGQRINSWRTNPVASKL